LAGSCSALLPLGERLSVEFGSTDCCGDLTNLEGQANTVCAVKFDLIVNATVVDKAALEAELARTINAFAPAVLAAAVSARCSFTARPCWKVAATYRGASRVTGLLNVDGATRSERETLIQPPGCHHLIFHTRWMYAARQQLR
jgi:dTDP-4-dehydrorhamnose reductase